MINICFRPIFVLVLLGCSTASLSGTACLSATDCLSKAQADLDAYHSVAKHADSIHCQADQLKLIAKANLRGTDCYRKIRGNIALIKLRAGKVRRRANSIRRANWEKEFNRLEERMCQIGELIHETYRRSASGLDRALPDCCLEIQTLLDGMAADLQCMRIAFDCPVPETPVIGIPRATRRPLMTPTLPAPDFQPLPGNPVELPSPSPPAAVPPAPQPAFPTSPPRRSILESPNAAKLPSSQTIGSPVNSPIDSALKAARTTKGSR